MWIREFGTAKVGELRVKQLAETAPDVIATSCPYCLIMLEDGVKSLGMDNVQCKDLIELVTTAATVEEKNS
jgi:Fe-S oxidoreductase